MVTHSGIKRVYVINYKLLILIFGNKSIGSNNANSEAIWSLIPIKNFLEQHTSKQYKVNARKLTLFVRFAYVESRKQALPSFYLMYDAHEFLEGAEIKSAVFCRFNR